MADEPRDPSLEDLLERFREVMLDGIRTTLPGRITAYDSTTQLASAQPEIPDRRVEEDGSLTPVTLPVVHRAPVMFLGANSKGRITWPVQVGDACTIYYCSSYIARWVALGRIVDPGDDRRHDLADAIVAPSLHGGTPPTDAPTDALVVHADTVKLGSSGASQHAVGDSALTDFITALTTAMAATSAPVDAPGLHALTNLKTALQMLNGGLGWGPRTSKVLIE